jgi:hypothetical protein
LLLLLASKRVLFCCTVCRFQRIYHRSHFVVSPTNYLLLTVTSLPHILIHPSLSTRPPVRLSSQRLPGREDGPQGGDPARGVGTAGHAGPPGPGAGGGGRRRTRRGLTRYPSIHPCIYLSTHLLELVLRVIYHVSGALRRPTLLAGGLLRSAVAYLRFRFRLWWASWKAVCYLARENNTSYFAV